MSEPITKIEKEEKARPTPGPWICDDFGRIYGAPDPRSKYKNGRPFITQVVDEAGRHHPHLDNGLIDEEAQATARLMAAAPSLLAAAKRIVPFVQVDYDSARSDPFASFEDVAALHELEAAIAEAEGGA